MAIESRFQFIAGSRSWALVRRVQVSTVQLDAAVPAYTVISELDRWCADPVLWPRLLNLFEQLSGPISRAPTQLDVERHIKPALRAAFETRTWLAYSTTSLQNAATLPSLQIVSPAPNTVFAIDDTPQMPAINVEASIQGVLPNPTPVTSFKWSAELRHNPRAAGDRHGPNREFLQQMAGTAIGGRFTVAFPQITGGALTVKVRADVNGRVIESQTVGLTVVGTNPMGAAVQAQIGTDLLRRIACHESHHRHFDAPKGGRSRSPYWSQDNLGGVGLFQITVPQPTSDEVWNWKANVAKDRSRLEQGRAAARNYPRQIRGSRTLAGMLAALNASRRAAGLPALSATVVPDLTPDQVEDDAVRAFNGYGTERDQFGYPLHEFRLVMAGADLALVIDEAALTATASWERVPVADRGTSGDPNYVHNVHAANPACP